MAEVMVYDAQEKVIKIIQILPVPFSPGSCTMRALCQDVESLVIL